MKELFKKGVAECIGTAVLVLFGCGVAIWTNCDPVATSLAFGLSIVAMAYSIGNVSGCHVNPAVSLAMLIKKKITFKEFCVYVASQLLGATVGCLLLMMIFGTDCGYGANVIQASPTPNAGQYIVALVSEIVLTFAFVLAICGVTSKKKNGAVAGIVIGLTLTLVHLLGLHITGTSVNPARSLMPALFALTSGTAPIAQVWIFIVGPLAGGALAALVHNLIDKDEDEVINSSANPEPEVVETSAPKTTTEAKIAPKTTARTKTTSTAKPRTTKK